jgi:hypothetical protein
MAEFKAIPRPLATGKRGITAVMQVGEEWVAASMLTHLGNIWVMVKPKRATPRSLTVRITSISGIVYGVYEVRFNCKDECTTEPGTDAIATKMKSAACLPGNNTCSS